MYAPKEKVVEREGGSVGVLVCFMFGEIFFPCRMFFQISTEINLQVIIIFAMSGKRGEDAPCKRQNEPGTIPT